MNIHADPITDAVNAAKSKSCAYAEWQSALRLRDEIYRAVGSGSLHTERVNDLIRYWSEQWKAEEAEIVHRFALPSGIERALRSAERVKANHQTSSEI